MITSAKDVLRIVPEHYKTDGVAPDDAPVYIARAPLRGDIGRLETQLTTAGFRTFQDGERRKLLRHYIRNYIPEEGRDELYALLEQRQEIADQIEGLPKEIRTRYGEIDVPSDEFDALEPEHQAIIERAQQYELQWRFFEMQVEQTWDFYAALVKSDRERNAARYPMVFSMLVTGWENVDVPFKTDRGRVSEAAMADLDFLDVIAVGGEILRSMYVSADAEKNSGSPSSSSSNPKGSGRTRKALGTSSVKQ